MPPTPIWKMRSLLFWLTCAPAGHESEAMPVVMTAPDLRKLRRVTGEPERELDWMFMVIRRSSCMDAASAQAELCWSEFPACSRKQTERWSIAATDDEECFGPTAPKLRQ